MSVYQPAEDSYLLEKYVKKYSEKDFSVLDIGTGSGIQAIAAAKIVKDVVACDINPEAISSAKEEAKNQKIQNIKFIQSDLFSKVPKTKFDLILFNPPYLPEDELKEMDIALVSGKKGTETTLKFLEQAGDFLLDKGTILIIGSSLAKQSFIDDAIKKNLLESETLETQHIFFEDMFVLKLVKSELLKKLHKNNINNAKIFAHGKRGVIIKAVYNSKEVSVKVKRDTSTAKGTIENEARFLTVLNKKRIGPKFVMQKEDFLMYEFVNGKFIFDFIKESNKKDILIVLKKVFEQMYTLDKLGINKFEMHHPIKHILIDKNSPVLIDFERARYTQDPKNVTQFCDFLIGEDMTRMLTEKKINIPRINIIELAREYKENLAEDKYKRIFALLR
jgi:HemK-related putative methylase